MFVQDGWKFNNRLTLNLGLRVDHYKDGWPDQEQTPNGIPALSGSLDPLPAAEQTRIRNFYTPRTVDARTVAETTTVGPRAGFTYDLRGDGKSVIKGFYGRFYFNSADIIANNENPVGLATLRYRFNDQNGNGLLDGPQELGAFITTLGGAGFVTVDPEPEAAVRRRDLRALRAGAPGRALGPRVVRLQEPAERVGRSRRRAERQPDGSGQPRRSLVQLACWATATTGPTRCSTFRQAPARSASSPIPTIRRTTPTTRRSSWR